VQVSQTRIRYESQRASQLMSALHDTLALYGYQVLETPIIEAADLFLTKAGDQLINKLFTFERHGLQLALRPEFTAAAAHHYAQQADSTVVRWQFGGLVFEDAPDDIQQNYQHLSVGAELMGMVGAAADAEILSLAVQGIASQGVANWQLVVGHVGLMRLLLDRFDLDNRTQRFLLNHLATLKAEGKAEVLHQLDHALLGIDSDSSVSIDSNTDNMTALNTQQMLNVLLDATERGMTMGGRTRQDIARRLLQKRQRTADRQQIIASLDFLENWSAISGSVIETFRAIERFIAADDSAVQTVLMEWRRAIDILEACEIPLDHIIIQPDLARSWDYYTGIVFELRAEGDIHLGGGGRYDELVSLIGGQQRVPAVGFAYYVDQLLDAVPDSVSDNLLTIFIAVNDGNEKFASQWAYRLRSQHITVQLLPDDQIPQREIVVEVDSNGLARTAASTFTLQQIDLLMTSLKK
jgi:histidyl-tRNA synthetase